MAEHFSISVRTVYCLIDEGELRRAKARVYLRIPVEEAQNYEAKLSLRARIVNDLKSLDR